MYPFLNCSLMNLCTSSFFSLSNGYIFLFSQYKSFFYIYCIILYFFHQHSLTCFFFQRHGFIYRILKELISWHFLLILLLPPLYSKSSILLLLFSFLFPSSSLAFSATIVFPTLVSTTFLYFSGHLIIFTSPILQSISQNKLLTYL